MNDMHSYLGLPHCSSTAKVYSDMADLGQMLCILTLPMCSLVRVMLTHAQLGQLQYTA